MILARVSFFWVISLLDHLGGVRSNSDRNLVRQLCRRNPNTYGTQVLYVHNIAQWQKIAQGKWQAILLGGKRLPKKKKSLA